MCMHIFGAGLTDTLSAACTCEYWESAVPVLVREPAEDGREDARELALELPAARAAWTIHCSIVCAWRLREAFSPKYPARFQPTLFPSLAGIACSLQLWTLGPNRQATVDLPTVVMFTHNIMSICTPGYVCTS